MTITYDPMDKEVPKVRSGKEYLEFRHQWRKTYKQISLLIRKYRSEMKDCHRSGSDSKTAEDSYRKNKHLAAKMMADLNQMQQKARKVHALNVLESRGYPSIQSKNEYLEVRRNLRARYKLLSKQIQDLKRDVVSAQRRDPSDGALMSDLRELRLFAAQTFADLTSILEAGKIYASFARLGSYR